jgi:hypothetical protein
MGLCRRRLAGRTRRLPCERHDVRPKPGCPRRARPSKRQLALRDKISFVRTVVCPACLTELDVAAISYHRSFACPACERQLRVFQGYPLALAWGSILSAGMVIYGSGFRGSLAAALLLIALLPMNALLQLSVGKLFPPRLRLVDSTVDLRRT